MLVIAVIFIIVKEFLIGFLTTSEWFACGVRGRGIFLFSFKWTDLLVQVFLFTFSSRLTY